MAPSKLSNDARKKLAANLQVLRRYDEQIEAIVDTTSHVVLYQFQEATQSWANKSVEGALFIYKRSAAPYYGFTILNRVGLENYTELLDADMSFQTSGQIVIYTSKNSGGIVGVWIYEDLDRVRIPEQLGMCCQSSKSAFAGQGPQCLYPKNAEEEKEFTRLYPRSRSNSRKGMGPGDGNGSNALSTVINRTRQQQQQQRKQSQSVPVPANDLVSKLQAIGLNPSGVSGTGDQTQAGANNADALSLDPAIIMARKSVKPLDMQPAEANGEHALSPGKAQAQAQASGASESSSAFRSPLSVPASTAAIPPASPVLHPAPSPFPPSTIATPLPGQGLPRTDPGAAYMAQMQQFWHPQMAGAAIPRSAHASPAPMGYGVAPGVHSFPQLPVGMGHPGTAHTPQPGMSMAMAPVQFVPGMAMPPLPPSLPPHSMPPGDGGAVGTDAVAPPPLAAAPPGPNTSMAQNLADQLVSLVRQRMNAVQHGPQVQEQQQQHGLPPNAAKMQRDYCREWLIRVIQADDELVDAFAQRFPPPIFAQQQQQNQSVQPNI
ncbi:hypothetical protein LPJ53_003737 [Coemansia erecta]|uniref:PH domain-like protein n=1 Tax=Coemansia erecta TaxID=147472 RepID=A0A9W7XVP1_9FUNG|nr:hypothetical protein LPJ53_003737 [Coemansia erecta]